MTFRFFFVLQKTALDHSQCQQAITNAKNQMQHSINTQLLAIKEKLYSLEYTASHKLHSDHITNQQELSEKIDMLATENNRLKQQIIQLQSEHVELKKNLQPIDQLCEDLVSI
jgi:septal ring factor EnvC (AmiA/AmiB activator)